MRAAGRVVADALAAARAHAQVGVSLRELDAVGCPRRRRCRRGAALSELPAELGRHPVPGGALHVRERCCGARYPSGYRLRDGDLVSIDGGARLNGWCGDSAISFVVGAANPADEALVAATDEALRRGIEAARVGNRLGDIGAAIGTFARSRGFGLLADHGGHGIGRVMHESPDVPNEARAGRGMRLRAGLVLAIEPMLIADGSDDYRHDADGWTLRTVTGARAAHSEHTVAITDDGPVVLTARH
ncbi:type I methionyl aminopeptidase [Rhodococcus hoagii]|nr:type I methionyl aminopeptidase [Prescottella equi]